MPGVLTKDKGRQHQIDEIENWNIDRDVDPPTRVIGNLVKSGSSWIHWGGAVSSNDGALFRVSALQDDADDLDVSAKSSDAGTLLVSAKQDDAALLRMSAIGLTGLDISNDDAGDFLVSSKQGDAGLLRMSATADDASLYNVSAKSDDGALLRTSAVQDGAAALNISAKSDDGALLRTSAVQDDGVNLNISAKSGDGALFRVSALGPGDIVTRHSRASLYTVDGFADTSTVHLDAEGVDTQTAFMLIDISDTVNWKHTNTDHVIIRHILFQVDPDSSYLGEVEIGFLTNVDGDNGNFNQILDLDLARKSDLLFEDLTFTGGFHCQTATHFGPITANSTLFQTDVNLQGPSGATSFPSGDGDLVMIVERSAGTVDVSVTIIYETVGA